jgi:hypothetical protein
MTDLAQRLEAAQEGSRELSDEVLLLFGWTRDNPGLLSPSGDYHTYTEYGCDNYSCPVGPCPTTSLDACKALMPEGWSYAVSHDAEEPASAGMLQCGSIAFQCVAATPELAWCAALVRANAQEKT